MKIKNKKNNTKKLLLISLIVAISLFVVTLTVCLAIILRSYRKTNYEETAETTAAPSEVEQSIEEEIETLAPEDEEEIERAIREATRETEPEIVKEKDKENYNLLLVGVDRRDASWNGNSDVMMLVTIDYEDETITLTSFMRDLGVVIDDLGVRKLNHAFAVGGGPLLMSTIENNFGIHIDNYAWVDFESSETIIDMLGGVDIAMSVEEAKYLEITIDSPQVVHLDGEHALLHSRNRSVGGTSDYGRTQRQRDIVLAIMNKAKSGGFSDLAKLANEVLPYVNHNISQGKLIALIMDLPKIKDYEFLQQRVPFDGLYHSQGEYLIPHYKETNEKLQETLN